ncbi:MAG TPA: Ig-like domain-containing protein, partial [Iamia sp.]|nr:Ig-like domain-containing protein [Iamia sp.]
MTRSITSARRAVALLAAIVAMACLVVTGAFTTAPAGAASPPVTTALGSWSGGLSCTSWGSVSIPANATSVTFKLWGGGGAAGDNTTYLGNTANGGSGGRGSLVEGSVAGLAGQTVWAKVGCGGTDSNGDVDAQGYAKGRRAPSFFAGGGGAASALCVGATAQCGSGSVFAIAAGGGGGGKANLNLTATRYDGGDGGNGSGGGTTARNQGNGRIGGAGQQGGNGGGGGGSGDGANAPGTTTATPAVSPGDTGMGGNGGNDGDYDGGGGGGGLIGGGGGGDGQNSITGYKAAGGGGAGTSWVRSTGTGIVTPSTPATTNAGTTDSDCSGRTTTVTGQNRGFGAAPGAAGCAGYAEITWVVSNNPTGAAATTPEATKGTPLVYSLANADIDGDNRTCSIATAPTKGSATLSGGVPSTGCTLSYTAAPNTGGNDELYYKVTDSDGNQSPSYKITIPIGNRAPVGGSPGYQAT